MTSAPDGTPCKGETSGLPGRHPVTASGFRLIGKETERGWVQSEDISTPLPSLLRYENHGIPGKQLRTRLLRIPLDVLERNGLEPSQYRSSAKRKEGAP
jgi:hypothetical protein